MQYKIKNTDTVFQRHEFATHFPNTSLPEILTQADLDFLGVVEEPDPEPTPPTTEELASQATAAAQSMQAAILGGMTQLFDATAQARNYDNRLTCALRAGYPGPFHDEGMAFATWVDAQNAKAYALLAQVQAGTMSMPESVEAALALLDPMVWPT